MQWGFNNGHLTLKIAELSCNPPLHGSPPALLSTYGVDKLKQQDIQLAVHYGLGSLIAIK